ncbi:DUF2849 domain-containing protein [Pinisolibacter sp.]|uniref:DUF2849 domain-containing protein n=1 Tax=Pinisolibacter sp. TaxID=2172024 RepID=UPI002FDD4F9D
MQVVTANRLIDGRVVFRDAAGRWCEAFAAAAALEAAATTQAVAESARDVAARLIVDPYAVDVVATPAGLTPTSMRERIRAGGPTSGSEVAAPRLDRAA